MNRIKDLRVSMGWTQEQLGERLGCSGVAIGRYERAARDLDVATINRLCDIFGCTADYLLGRSPMPTAELTPEEESLLLAYRRSDDRARDMVAVDLPLSRQNLPASRQSDLHLTVSNLDTMRGVRNGRSLQEIQENRPGSLHIEQIGPFYKYRS